MTDKFYFLEEPQLTFGSGQATEDPKDGLALFGPNEKHSGLPNNVVIGTSLKANSRTLLKSDGLLGSPCLVPLRIKNGLLILSAIILPDWPEYKDFSISM